MKESGLQPQTNKTSFEELTKERDYWKERFEAVESMAAMTNEYMRELQEELQASLDETSQINQNLTDSIRYAKQLQTSLLPSKQKIASLFPKNFVLYLPKDVVSGDFYWIHASEKYAYLAAIDCTGHGIPGAMLTVMVNSLLNQLVTSMDSPDPAELLLELDHLVNYNIRSHDANAERMNDGLDISVIANDRQANRLYFCGAHQSLIQIRAGKMTVFNGKRYSIGENSFRKERLKNEAIALEVGDKYYLFSDGYSDQFGGESKCKYTRVRFKSFLQTSSRYPLAEQKEMLEEEFKHWKGDSMQMDDVLIIGFEF